MTARVSSRRFVGREEQLAELARAYDQAASGTAWLALVGGESGVGKTRLVGELADRARRRGARVLSGDSLELAEGELPYAPLVGALRPLMRAGDPALADVRAELERPATDAAAQSRFFELLLGALDRLGAEAPLLLVLEDLHWADRSTRDFLAFLARNLCRERVLVVGTYRTDELVRRHPLRLLLPELDRLDRTVHVTVERLSRAELADQLADILGADPDPSLVDRLYARCEGNPLFAEELVAAGRDGRGELPPTLRDALTVRVEALSEPAQHLLRVIAAAARADDALLEEVSGQDRTTLRAALREALAHQVLVHGDDGRYAFRHALLREAMHDELLPGEHVELHLALARSLDARVAEGGDRADLHTVTAVAHHFAAAGEQPAALGTAVRAADAADRFHAPGEEAKQLERALKLWPRVPDAAERAGMDHVALLERLASACAALGDYERATHVLSTALDELSDDAPPSRAARLLERLGRSAWEAGRSADALGIYERGLALLADDQPSAERAMLLASKGKALMLAGVYPDAIEWCQRAIDAAREAGSKVAEANALNSVGVSLASLGDVDEGVACLQRSVDMSWAIDSIDGVCRGYVNIADVLLQAGRTQEALLVVVSAIAQLVPRGHRSTWIALQAVEVSIAVGDWEQAAERLARERAPRFVGTTAVYHDVAAGELALGRGDLAEATERLRRARALATDAFDPQWHAPIASLLAEALARQGAFEEARAVVDETHDRLARVPRMSDHARFARLAAAALAVEADVAQRARDLGDADTEANALARAHTWRRRAREAHAQGLPGTAPWAALAEAESARAGGSPEPGAWAAAAEAWDAFERPYHAACARWREAEALAQDGERAGAQAAARDAAEVARRIGSRWLADEIASLARRARLRLDGAPDAGVDEELADDPAAQLGLTVREREVLVLLAQGRTNREIGATLFMAEKTASVHVSRILAKLDVRSRTEAAAVAHRLGIRS